MNSPYKAFRKDKITDLAHMTERGQRVLHGDVIIIRCNESDMPTNFNELKDAKNSVLAEGEHSGHAHALFYNDHDYYVPPTVRNNALKALPTAEPTKGTFSVKVATDGSMYLRVEGEPVLLRHQEHTPFRIYPGTYEIGTQQETWGDLKRSVVD